MAPDLLRDQAVTDLLGRLFSENDQELTALVAACRADIESLPR